MNANLIPIAGMPRRRCPGPALLFLAVAAGGCGPRDTAPGGAGGGTADPGAAAGRPVIAVSLLTTANPFFVVIGDNMKSEASKRGYEVLVTGAEMDAARQRDQVKDFIQQKVAAIVLCPADSRAIGTAIKEANDAGIPVFTADIACLDKSVKVVSHIATDNYAGGRLAAQAMVKALGGKGKVAIIDHPEVESVLMRTKGFKEVIAKHPGIRIVAQLPGGAARDTALKTAQDILQQHSDLDGIFAINDPTAFGAVAALEMSNRLGKVKVVGFDGQPEAKQAIKEGKIYADPIQHPDQIGRMVVDTIARYREGQKPAPQVLIPTTLYTKADADQDPSLR